MATLTLQIPTINDSRLDFTVLAKIWQDVAKAGNGTNVNFNFSSCGFLRPNAVVFLGALARLIQHRGGAPRFLVDTMQSQVSANLLQNGFAYAMGDDTQPWQGNSIPYREYSQIDKNAIVYSLKNEWLGRGWVNISHDLMNEIAGRMSEIYVNAFDHSLTPIGVYSCGQHFPNRRELTLAVADFGVGIPSKVRFQEGEAFAGADAMRWAFTRGNSTARQIHGPRGMGLDLLKEFVRVNRGRLEIYSHDGYACIDSTGEMYENLPVFFEGTLVQVRLVCDNKLYLLSSEIDSLAFF
ncbi:ATP-binding protein [Candidatus Methylomicrobium oryzae]|uniref:ATP-binding protein n=1 Tax=Candidatus Methylomicrobium oryzae TaxID=2802053 RepID=UPI001921A887|nr:ATP-binding protein [Methylomicrobium sp. RS1]MBL1265870.1 ATP-binding protein [Methylomicrobium sp. RS1]